METPNEKPIHSTKLDILINQCYIAIDLYKHEDSLNWNKLNNLLYITGGFGAVFGFFLKNNLSEFTNYLDPLIIISFIGVVVSLSFCITIYAGVRYLKLRKKIVIKIDKKLKKLGGNSVMFVDAKKPKNIHIKSPTTMVLQGFPIFITCIWIIIFLARIL